ncbi:MAG: hypothetical protein U0R51_05980 [Solirubrobacterales bacterium]
MKTASIATATAAALLCLAALAPAGGAAAERAGGAPDTTPPDPFIRARTRQDMDYVFKHGIQTTCGTEDREHDITCRMTARRKGRVLATDSGHIDRPYNRYHFNLHLSGSDQDRIRDANPPVEVKLRLRVTDAAGNVAKVKRQIRIVAGLYDD